MATVKVVDVCAAFLLLQCTFSCLYAFDPLDPQGTIVIKWDINKWTDDGYDAEVTLFNLQQYRHVESPGWTLGWKWAQDEVIWNMWGAQAKEQGDCSKFRGDMPHSCRPDPLVVDLLPDAPYHTRIASCCRGGVLSSLAQNPTKAVGAFRMIVGGSPGDSPNSRESVKMPHGFTLSAPGPGYSCGPAMMSNASRFPTHDGRRVTQAAMTWKVTCVYTQALARSSPSCCVSLSAFYSKTIVPCPTCTCACRTSSTSCANQNDKAPLSVLTTDSLPNPELLYCTTDMYPIHIHWHVKANYAQHWRAKITILNRNLLKNYTDWTLVAQHPNFNSLQEAYSFNYNGTPPYPGTNDTAVFFGKESDTAVLYSAGPDGNVQSEILFRKREEFSFKQGWAFPRRIYFNGDNCVLPDPEDYLLGYPTVP